MFLVVGGLEPGVIVFKDGIKLNDEDLFDGNEEPSMEGAVGFAPSPNSIVPHNMFELEVLFDDSDPTLEGHNHGQYSLDPSHWGASIQQQGSDPLPNAIPDFECEVRDDNRILAVASTLPGDDLAVSSACVEVIGGTGGFTLVDPFIIPNSVLVDSLTVTVLVSIDIKPGSDPNSVNPRSKGKIPVAILSTADFDATTEVDKGSLTFGRTGDEDSLARCTKSDEDVNGDGLLDIVCHFNTSDAGFGDGDRVGILRGTMDGVLILGFDPVRVATSGGDGEEDE